MVLSETFWIAFVSSTSASCLIAMRWAYRSKCTHVEFCCLKIDRDVTGESQIDIVSPSSPENSQKIERNISL